MTEVADPITVGSPQIRPEPLLARAQPPRRPRLGPARVARVALKRLLNNLERASLTIVDTDGTVTTYGQTAADHKNASPAAGGRNDAKRSGLPSLSARINIRDDRAWSAVLSEGSIGLGRGYIEGWWTSEDPTAVVQAIIRNLHSLDDLRNRLHLTTGVVGDRLRRARSRPTRERNREDISSHYDLGNEFFSLFLDETMTYSAAMFTDPTKPLTSDAVLTSDALTGDALPSDAVLARASRNKYDRLAKKLGLNPSTSTLEIGTGWGGFAIQTAAETGAKITTTTVSERQRTEAVSRVVAAGLDDQVEVLGQDWRDLSGRYDRLVSIEMIEAVDWRDYPTFFATLERLTTSDGLIGLQAICVPDQRYERAKNTEDFVRRFIFPGGFLPSLGAIGRAVADATSLQIIDVEDFSAHYAETLRRWRQRFDDRLTEVRELGLDERFIRLWRFYLAYCEAGFAERHCTVNQIILAGPDWRPDDLSLRPL